MTRGTYQTYASSNELYHHGILGQKWGVRRYQNPDGTYTNVGKKRLRNEKRANKQELKDIRSELNSLYKRYDELDDQYTYGKNADISKNAKIDEEYSSINKRINELKDREKELDKGKLARNLAIAGGLVAAGATAYALYKNRDLLSKDFMLRGNNQTKNLLKAIAGETKYKLQNIDIGQYASKAKEKITPFVKENGKKAISAVGDSFKKAGKATLTAALASIGTIEIGILASKLDTSENSTEMIRNRNKILLDASTAGIQSLTNPSVNGSNKSNNSNNKSSKDFRSIMGEPQAKNNPVVKGSPEYGKLFVNPQGKPYSEETKNDIRAMVQGNYSLEQIRQYCEQHGTLKHSSMYRINFICHRAY